MTKMDVAPASSAIARIPGQAVAPLIRKPKTSPSPTLRRKKRSGNVVIFSHARGTPKTYRAPNLFDYAFCGYDDAGNLYVDGTNKSGAFELDERAVGSEHFGSIALDRTIRKAGPIQWDGGLLFLLRLGTEINMVRLFYELT